MSDLDELVHETIRGVSTYGKDQTVPQRGGGGGGQGVGGPRNRGKPGYPIPDSLRTGTTSGGSLEAEEPAIVGQLGEETIDESISSDDIPKSIEHLDDLSPADFISFLGKYRDLPISGGLEISEKVDGSARVSFGVKDGRIWTQSKNGPKRLSSNDYPDEPMYAALKATHRALESNSSRIVACWPEDVSFMVAEVLHTRIPNSIEYGPNMIIVHGVHERGAKNLDDRKARNRAERVTKAGDLNGWRFEYKRTIDPKDFLVDVKKEFDTIASLHDELKKLEPEKRRTAGKLPYKLALDQFKNVQKQIKDKLVGQLRKQSSAYGPQGGDVEGLVFRDLDSGKMTKLVDKDYFTKLNKFLWRYREMLDRGVKDDDQWKVGIMQNFRNRVADNVFNMSIAKTPGFVKHVKNTVQDAVQTGAPEQRGDRMLALYIQRGSAFPGDYVERFDEALTETDKQLQKLEVEWNSKKSKDIELDISDVSGNKIKSVKMDPIIKDRTDQAFVAARSSLAGIRAGLDVTRSIKDSLTKKVALLKLMMGRTRFEKLTQDGLKESVKFPEPPTISAGDEDYHDWTMMVKQNAQNIVNKHIGKLKKRGYDPGKCIGHGSQAGVFEMSGNRILKVTMDRTDALACIAAMRSPKKHVIQVHDVFRFPIDQHEMREDMKHVFGIVAEKLKPLNSNIRLDLGGVSGTSKLGYIIYRGLRWKDYLRESDYFGGGEFVAIAERYELDKLVDEMADLKIKTSDVSYSNLMMRGKTIVISDMGYSVSPEASIQKLEVIRRGTGSTDFSGEKIDPIDELGEIVHDSISKLIEGKVDVVGATIGRYQPFHAGHAAVIRQLATKFNKVIIFVAGQRKDADNPFGHDLRLKIMERSLSDVWNKLEVYPALIQGRGTGYLPSLFTSIAQTEASSVKMDTAVNILVGPDRVVAFKKQVEYNNQHADKPGHFGGPLEVFELPGVVGDDEAGRISATAVRDALISDKSDVVKKLMDPRFSSDPLEFKRLYDEMRSALEKTNIQESIESDAGLWDIDTTDDFDRWYVNLDHGDHEGPESRIVKKMVTRLEIVGSNIRAPYAHKLKPPNQYNLWELRQPTGQYPLRIIFGYEKGKRIILLCGGNKKGRGDTDTFVRALQNRAEALWRERTITETIINELGMGGLETGPGFTKGGAWGASGWSRAWLAKDDHDAESMYQQSLRSPNRLTPFTHGVPNDHMPGQDVLDQHDDDEDVQDLSDPTDLSK